MAQYKVPQDVEADDKLIGPFSFRQFVYLMIAGASIALAIFLFQLFPLLAVIPLPIFAFFIILALPLKKDQPMETYLAAIVSYYLKPRKRFWIPGQRESTISISAPKIVEQPRYRDISQSEAKNQLSFLSEVIDTEGQAIKNPSPMREEFAAEANNIPDMFENINSVNLDQMIAKESANQHQIAINQMQAAIANDNPIVAPTPPPAIEKHHPEPTLTTPKNPEKSSPKEPVIVQPEIPKKPNEKTAKKPPKSSIINLANNPDLSVKTIAKEANRINKKEGGEVYIALH